MAQLPALTPLLSKLLIAEYDAVVAYVKAEVAKSDKLANKEVESVETTKTVTVKGAAAGTASFNVERDVVVVLKDKETTTSTSETTDTTETTVTTATGSDTDTNTQTTVTTVSGSEQTLRRILRPTPIPIQKLTLRPTQKPILRPTQKPILRPTQKPIPKLEPALAQVQPRPCRLAFLL